MVGLASVTATLECSDDDDEIFASYEYCEKP